MSVLTWLLFLPINMNESCIDIQSAVKEVIQNNYNSSCNEESILLQVKQENRLPTLFDQSIIVEAHLRQIAFEMTK